MSRFGCARLRIKGPRKAMYVYLPEVMRWLIQHASAVLAKGESVMLQEWDLLLKRTLRLGPSFDVQPRKRNLERSCLAHTNLSEYFLSLLQFNSCCTFAPFAMLL